MLSRLYIENFALIESAEIEFGPGLNVVTGETGAGKSILLGALDSILGGAVGADSVRSGEERCVVEGLFEFPAPDSGRAIATRLAELGVELEADGQLTLRREMRANGRSRCLANGLVVPLKRLKQIAALLVDLHGQHEHQSLLDVTTHARFLDESGGLADRARSVADSYAAMCRCRDVVARLRCDRQELQREEELRQFQLTEIRELAPDPAEEEELERDVKVLENQAELVQGAEALYQELYQSDASTVDQLARARRVLERLAETDPSLSERAGTLGELVYAVEDLAAGLKQYVGSLDEDPERLERGRERLQELRRIKRKYGGSLEAVVALADELENRELRLGELEGVIAAAEGEAAAAASAFAAHCIEHSSGRQQAADALSRALAESLRELGMPGVVFRVGLERVEDEDSPVEEDGVRYRADELGMERVEFLISANAGEEPRPLARIASGGEISRVMLALKEIIASGDVVSTLVFDEVDVGISGRIAAAVGSRLERLGASHHQVIVITHLPQIASLATLHLCVRKRQAGGRTFTEIVELDEAGRKEEIAALLAGASISDTARQHAREMLE